MPLDSQNTFIAIGAVFIVGILLDAWRRSRKAQAMDKKLEEILSDKGTFGDSQTMGESYLDAPQKAKRQIDKNEILAVTVMAKKGSDQLLKSFSGSVLFAALRRMRLYHGKHEVFHRFEAGRTTGTPIFSVAQANEPGFFRLSEMTSKTFNGIILYLNVHEYENLPKGFEEMIETAYHLAEILGGIVCDIRRHPLTYQQIEDLRVKAKSLQNAQFMQAPLSSESSTDEHAGYELRKTNASSATSTTTGAHSSSRYFDDENDKQKSYKEELEMDYQ